MVKKRARKTSGHVQASGKMTEKNAAIAVTLTDAWPYIAACIFSLSVCFSFGTLEEGTRTASIVVCITALAVMAARFRVLRKRLGLPSYMLTLYVIVDGASALYSANLSSGSNALYALIVGLNSYCIALIFTAISPGDRRSAGKWIATVISGATCIIGFLSIDLISTRFFSAPVLNFLSKYIADYSNTAGIQPGVRLTSIFSNGNVFAGAMGIGVLLSLGALSDEAPGWKRWVLLTFLYIDSLAFLLSFSMGATGTIVLAFAVYLFLEHGDSRSRSFVLMVETLILTMISSMVISATSFTAWTGNRPVPLICSLFGAVDLCLLDRYVGGRLAELPGKSGRLASVVLASTVTAAAIYAVAAFAWTDSVSLHVGEVLRRAAYLESGEYSLMVEANGDVRVVIESQNMREAMMHTSTLLYDGAASEAEFVVPEDSKVVYFDFSSMEGAAIEQAEYRNGVGAGKLPLGYKLLPEFIAARMQGLFANENAIQRVVFFQDGLKLFKERPLFGWGLGGFESNFRRAQSFFYSTRYVHNHYVEVMIDKGIVGILAFTALLLGCCAALWRELRRGKERNSLAPALGAVLTFMACHAAVEIVFSAHHYLPFAYTSIMLMGTICPSIHRGESDAKKPGNRIGSIMVAVSMTFILIFSILIWKNLNALHVTEKEHTINSLEKAIESDPFEWSSYAVAYLHSVTEQQAPKNIVEKGEEYAKRLERNESIAASYALAQYYFKYGKIEEAMGMTERHVRQIASDGAGWQSVFDMMEKYYDGSDMMKRGILHIWDMMEEWNENNLGNVTVKQSTRDFITRLAVTGRAPSSRHSSCKFESTVHLLPLRVHER